MIMVSVIVPVYNAEIFLEKCIGSILAQDYSSFEVILIDDGSSDNSGLICDRYAQIDSRVKAFHQNHAGVSVARNKGIRNATGQYIVFSDADDLLPLDSLSNRMEAMGEADLLISSYDVVDTEAKSRRSAGILDKKEWNREEALCNLFSPDETGYQGYLWNKMFRLHSIREHGLFFAEGIAYNEDRLFVMQYVLACKTIFVSNHVVYHYREHENGAMGNLSEIEDDQIEKIMTEFAAFHMMQDILSPINQKAFYLCKNETLRRACKLKKERGKNSHRLEKALNAELRYHAFGMLSAPGTVIDFKHRIKCLLHGILLR